MARKTRAQQGYDVVSPTSSQDFMQRQKIIKSIKAKADAKRSFSDKLIDRGNAFFGSNLFLYINVVWFALWLAINLSLVPIVKPFDPFPFSFLTSAVSLEAIILAIFVLISQNRAARVADIREEVQLQINTLAEEENTKIMRMLVLLLQKNKIPIPENKEVREMLKKTDRSKMEKSIEKQISKA